MADPAVVASIQTYLAALEKAGVPVSFGVLFGSYAQGNPNHLSDIDLLVVSPRFDGGAARTDVNLLWRTAARTDSRIEPVPCGVRQWNDDSGSTIIEVARRHGQRIAGAT